MAWLTGFNYRSEITIDNSKIDSALTDFPVLIAINSASGTGNQDLTDLFSELSTDSNRKKIAVTTSDGTTQCYVEIESYDFTAQTMNINAKVPSILSGVDTTLYLYWDSTASDNTTYVGDTGDAAAQSVWDSSFKAVWHLIGSYNGTAGESKDSTSSAKHGQAPTAGHAPTEASNGPKGTSQVFDGTEILQFPPHGMTTGGLTVELIAATTNTLAMYCYDDGGAATIYRGLQISKFSTQTWDAKHTRQSSGSFAFQATGGSSKTCADGAYRHVALAWDGTVTANKAIKYINGRSEVQVTSSVTQAANFPGTQTAVGGFWYNSAWYPQFNGNIVEVRVSNTQRSAAWLKATYNTQFDTLHSVGAPETGTPVSSDPDTFYPDDNPHHTGDVFMNVTGGDSWFEVMTCWEKDTAFDIQNTWTVDTAWDIINDMSIDTAWDILSAYDKDTAWDILNYWTSDTSWDILNSETKNASWDILNETLKNSAWDILNSFDNGFSWHVFPRTIVSIAIFKLLYVRYNFETPNYYDPVNEFILRDVQSSFSMKQPIQSSFRVTNVFDKIVYP